MARVDKRIDLFPKLIISRCKKISTLIEEGKCIQVVTFTSEINRSDYESMVIEGAPVWAAVPGLIIKHFIYNFDEGRFGGIYLWEDEESMQDYCKSDLFKSVIEHPAFSEHNSQIFEVHELGRIIQENK